MVIRFSTATRIPADHEHTIRDRADAQEPDIHGSSRRSHEVWRGTDALICERSRWPGIGVHFLPEYASTSW